MAGMARALGGHVPEEHVRVDVAAHTNWAGAYTTDQPAHVMMSSTDPDLEGWRGLETVVHESAHTHAVGGDHMEVLDDAFSAVDARPPRRFWHALIFYTTGELLGAALADAGIEGFVPYAENGGFYEGDSWRGYREAFDTCWRPMLEGELPREEAYACLAAALTG